MEPRALGGGVTSEDALINRSIALEESPASPADVRLRGSRIHVWALIGDLPLAGDDPQALAEGFGIPIEAVQAAIAYYARHRTLIDARIREKNPSAA